MSEAPPRRIGWRRGEGAQALVAREWLLTNGLGGYASGTGGRGPTRPFHCPLGAALRGPFGRMMMLNHLAETLVPADGAPIALTGLEGRGGLMLPDALVELALENGRPVWTFEHEGLVLEKRIVFTHRQNTVRV